MLKLLSTDPEMIARATSPERVRRLWAACGLPDFRKTGPEHHSRLVARLFGHLGEGDGRIPQGWYAEQVARLDNVQGDIETLADRIAGLLRDVGLRGLERRPLSVLSGGELRRVLLAHALDPIPELLILDEPLGQLDSLTRITMQGELVSLWQRAGFTALLVTHDVEEALFLAGRVIVLSQRPAQIRAEIVNPRPYPRRRGDPHLAELRHQVLAHLGLDATW